MTADAISVAGKLLRRGIHGHIRGYRHGQGHGHAQNLPRPLHAQPAHEVELPPFVIDMIQLGQQVYKAPWPRWMFVVQTGIAVLYLIASAVIGYSIGCFMVAAVTAQSSSVSRSGYAPLMGDESDVVVDDHDIDTTNADEENPKRAATTPSVIHATTNIKSFFRNVRALTRKNWFSTLFRGGRAYAVFAIFTSIALNIADSCALGPTGAPTKPNMTEKLEDLPVLLPGGSLASIIAIFLATLVVKPFHAMWIHSVLRTSPVSGSWFSRLRSLPFRSLMMPAMIESAATTLSRMIGYATFRYSLLTLGNSFVAFAAQSQPNPDVFCSAMWSIAAMTLLSPAAQAAMLLPASIILIRAEAHALVRGQEPKTGALRLGEENEEPTLRTLVKIEPEAKCAARHGGCAWLASLLPCSTVRNVLILTGKHVAIQAALFTVAGVMIVGLAAVVAAVDGDIHIF